MDYDDILRNELLKKQENNENELLKKQKAIALNKAKDFEKLVKQTKKWDRLNSEAESFIIGDVEKVLLEDINYLTSDGCYYIYCCQIADNDNNIIDIRLPGVVYDFNFNGEEKQLCGKLNIYNSTGKIGIIPIEATDYDKLQEALDNGLVTQIENHRYLLASFDDKNKVLLVTDQNGKIVETIVCEA
jgi:hypothetical protein